MQKWVSTAGPRQTKQVEEALKGFRWEGTAHVTARYNHTHGGVEISFQVKPDATVIARLKSYGFRWSMRSRCWWHKLTPQAEALAVEMAGEIRGGKPTAGEIRPDPMGVDRAYEDACAAACGL